MERDSETARRGVSGVDLSAMKKGKSSAAAIPKDPQIALRQKKDAEEANNSKTAEKSSDKKRFKGMMSKLTQKLRSNSLSESKPPKKTESQERKLPQKSCETNNSEKTETSIQWNNEAIKNATQDPEKQRDSLLKASNKKSSKSSGSVSASAHNNEEGEEEDDFAPTVESVSCA